ncbi:MAG: hypothetical protein KDD82_21835 [Planctomycetes bacterium]|nr:hypothetical protein [Planctomycetota bacterium]
MSRLLIVLLCCGLWGCSSDPEPAPEPKPEPTVKEQAPPTDAPPLSGPRPKLIPGDVLQDEEQKDKDPD